MAQLLPSVVLINYHILHMPYLHLDKEYLRSEVILMLLSVPITISPGRAGLVCHCKSKVHTLARLRMNFLSIMIAAVAMIL